MDQASRRTYLALTAAGLTSLGLPLAQAATLFNSQPVDASRFAVLARPVGSNDWKLLVVEQLQPAPACWEQRPDGLISPSLNSVNANGVCRRYLDGNAYSLRIGNQDLISRYRLQLRQNGSELRLEASTPSDPTVLVVGRAPLPQLRQSDGFVALTLEPGWDLQRRAYGAQSLSHLYFANVSPLPLLLARASGATAGLQPPLAPPPVPLSEPQRGNRNGRNSLLAQGLSQGAIPLPVIPFRE